MGNHPQRLSQFPLWQGVGGKTLVKHGKGNFKIFTLQVGKQFFDVGWHDQPFVRHQRPGKTGNVEVWIFTQLVFNFFAGQINQSIETVGCNQCRWDNKQLHDVWQRLQGIFTQSVSIQWDDTGQEDAQVILFTILLKYLQLFFSVAEE